MSTSVLTTSLGKIAQGVEGVAPGIIPVTGGSPSPLQQIANSNPNQYVPNPQGAQALQVKSQGAYSNKQFVAPMKFSLNVEGTSMIVDYLGKRIITDNNVPYRQIVSLSAVPLVFKTINDPSLNNMDRLVKPTPIQSAAAKMINTGTSAVTQSLGNRISQIPTTVQSALTQVRSLASGNIISNGIGQISNFVPTSQINQALAKIPGLDVATNALGTLPGTADLTKALQNPVGAATSLVQGAFDGSSLNIQAGLPSVSLGSLGDVFSLASNLASSGPPTSLTGLISLEQSIKSIVCNFTLPIINIPPYDAILKFKFPKPSDIVKQVKKQLDDLISNVINQLDVVKLLKNLLPDPHQIYEAIIKEITTCDKKPNNKNNAKNGKGGGGGGANTAGPIAAQDANGNFNGFANAEGAKILAQTSGPSYGIFGEAGLQSGRPTIGL